MPGIEPSEKLRAPGGGDKPLIDKQPGLLAALDELVGPETRGNPMAEAFIDDGQPAISVDTKKKVRHDVARGERTRRSEVRPMPVA